MNDPIYSANSGKTLGQSIPQVPLPVTLRLTNNNRRVSQWHRAYEYAKKLGVEGALEKSQQRGGAHDYVGGIKLREFPSGLSKAPVEYENLETGEKMNLTFYGGIVATYQHSDGALEARSGWAVVE
ncbi:MAG: hypothetical protein EZS28_055729, partial [Streblomastix strix]